MLGEPVVAVVGDHEGTVHVAVAQVAHRAGALGARTRQQQHELEVALGQNPVHAAEPAGEERVTEDAFVRLREDHGHRVGTPRRQAARCPVGREAEPADRGVDGGLCPRTDPVTPVDRPGRGGPGHARQLRNLFEGGGPDRGVPGSTGVHARHASDSRTASAGRTPVDAIPAYQCALALGVRSCVVKSTCTRPKRPT